MAYAYQYSIRDVAQRIQRIAAAVAKQSRRLVRDPATFESLYRRIGDHCADAGLIRRFDTQAAREVERRIGRELREPSSGVLARR